MSAISPELLDTIKEVQAMPSLAAFALAGGTNLALRYDHRQSVDIDLFSDQMVGMAGLTTIENELRAYYGDRVLYCSLLDPEYVSDQCVFLRAVIQKTKEVAVKIEVIQNIPLLDPFEQIDGIRCLSERDIGVLKLSSVSNRKAKKDVYDLDYITDLIPLEALMASLQEKEATYADEVYRNTFDVGDPPSPTQDTGLLMAFDHIDYSDLPKRPNHSNDNLDLQDGHKDWRQARRSWRSKVMAYMRANGEEPGPAKPIA
jgi:hypothetical protein